MANETTTTVDKPTILVNGVAQSDQITGEHTANVRHNPVGVFTGPVGISFNADPNATIRYTLNGKNPTLGSPEIVQGAPVTVRYNGNGFSSDNTVIKAKAYLNGIASPVAKLVINIR